MKWDHVFTEKFLTNELNNKTITQIARECNCCTKTIYKYLKKFNIKIIPKNKVDKSIIGQTINNIYIDSIIDVDKFKKAIVKCICFCGREFQTNAASVKRNLTTSCGCNKAKYCRRAGYKDISYQYFRRLKNYAERDNKDFTITLKDIWEQYEKQNKKCYLTGLSIVFSPNYNKIVKQTASIDRLDSNKGYTKDNIKIVHKRSNVMKGNMSLDELKFWIYHMYHNLNPQNIIVEHHQIISHNGL